MYLFPVWCYYVALNWCVNRIAAMRLYRHSQLLLKGKKDLCVKQDGCRGWEALNCLIYVYRSPSLHNSAIFTYHLQKDTAEVCVWSLNYFNYNIAWPECSDMVQYNKVCIYACLCPLKHQRLEFPNASTSTRSCCHPLTVITASKLERLFKSLSVRL